jgi:hypothetical protein
MLMLDGGTRSAFVEYLVFDDFLDFWSPELLEIDDFLLCCSELLPTYLALSNCRDLFTSVLNNSPLLYLLLE